MSKKKIILRADGNVKMGLGHIYRCIAIAEMIKEDFSCEFLLGHQSQFENVIPKYFSVKYIPEMYSIENEYKWISENYNTNSLVMILDGYQFNSSYQKNIKELQIKLIYIDDLQEGYMYADAIINHSPGVNSNLYIKGAVTKIYTGLEYVLLRHHFLNESKEEKKVKVKISSALITLGGSDEHNITLKILNSLTQIDKISTINIVVGAAYPHKTNLLLEINRSNKKIYLFSNLSELEMIELMKKSDIAFAPCSTICLELIAVNSVVFAGYSASNQKHLYNYLKSQQLIFDLNDLKSATSHKIKDIVLKHIDNISEINKMLALQKQIIDGKSGDRVTEIVKDLI
jgi:UDP-2,4-diacetamido-2,4,6-trideoxy-beta-L-altropyranose hydrolase